MNLGQIVQHRHQLPLTVDLLFTAQSESFDPYGIVDMTENRFDNPEARAVNVTADCGIDLLFHPLQWAMLLFGDAANFNIDLSGAFLPGAA